MKYHNINEKRNGMKIIIISKMWRNQSIVAAINDRSMA